MAPFARFAAALAVAAALLSPAYGQDRGPGGSPSPSPAPSPSPSPTPSPNPPRKGEPGSGPAKPPEPPPASADVPAGEKVDLRLRLPKGAKLRFKTVIDQTIVQNVGGIEQGIEQSMGTGMLYECKEVDAQGVMTLESTFESVSMKMTSPMMEMEFDSAKPPAAPDPVMQSMGGMVGKKLLLSMDPRGRVTKLEGVTALIDDVIKGMKLEDPMMADQVRQLMVQNFGDETLKETFSQMSGYYPEKPVAVGETWKSRHEMKKPSPMVLELSMTLKSRKDGRATVAMDCKVSPPKEVPVVDMGGAKVKTELSGTQKGTIEFDEATGWTRSCLVEQEFKGSVTVVASPEMDGEDMVIPMTVKGKVAMTTTE
jgi:hypothetical protein